MDTVTNLAMGQLEYYVDRADYHQLNGNADLYDFFIQQGRDLAASLSATVEDESLFYMTFHRLVSEDNGAAFLADHNDSELL